MRASVLLVALLALLAVCGAQAVAQGKLLRRAQPSRQQFTQPAMLQTQEHVEADESNEIVQSLKQLLEEKKRSGEAARMKLESAAQHTLAVEAALAAKQKQLKSHNAMLARLEQCLQQGPAEQRAARLERDAAMAQQSLLEARSTVEQKNAQLSEQAEELEAQKEHLDTAQSELADKQHALQQAQAHLSEQQSLLEKQAAEVAAKEAKLHETVLAEVNARVAAKIDAVRAEADAKHAHELHAVQAAMQAQAQSLMHSQQTMLMERKAAKIARVHEMHDLTSADSSPYAVAADEALAAEAEAIQPSLIEMSTSQAPVASSVPAPVTNSTLSRWAQKLAAHCARYSACNTCGSDGRCAWCAAGTGGKCLALDVNANLRAGSASGDGLTSGQCTSDNWQTSVASRLTMLSLNVFASERGNSTRRFAAIVQLIKKSGADVVGLQEVEKWFVHALQAHSWIKNNYHLTEYGPGQAPGGLYILSRYPIASINYFENIKPGAVEVSARGRVLVAKLGVKQQAVYVATTALDYRSSDNRAASLEFIFRTLKPYRHAFLLGDFNFDEGSKVENQAVPKSYLDLWPTLISDRPGYTWDPRSNWFAAASDPRSRASRIDRVYLRSNQWMPRSIHLVGCSVADPLCGAKNLDVKKGVTVIDANKLNPALILAAPTNLADKLRITEQEWGTKIFLELEQSVAGLKGTPEHAQVLRALADEAALEAADAAGEQQGVDEAEEGAFVELGASVSGGVAAPKPTFEPDFVPSNHYGLLVQTTQFAPRCPNLEEI